MRFCKLQHQFYCGIDSHPRNLQACTLHEAIHNGKTKNDKIDSLKIAALLSGFNFLLAYSDPAHMRTTLDLLRQGFVFLRPAIRPVNESGRNGPEGATGKSATTTLNGRSTELSP